MYVPNTGFKIAPVSSVLIYITLYTIFTAIKIEPITRGKTWPSYSVNIKILNGRVKRIWYLSPMRAAKVQAILCIRCDSGYFVSATPHTILY